jgi:hypothetical protein
MQQALDSAVTLNIPFVFSSNGDGFVFHDRTGASMEKEATVPLENLETLRRRGLYSFPNSSSDADFSQNPPRHSVFDGSLARRPRAREPGSAPPSRRASAVGEKAPEIDYRGPCILGLSFPSLAQLVLGSRHRQARNGRGLASRRLSPVLDLEGCCATAMLSSAVTSGNRYETWASTKCCRHRARLGREPTSSG